MGGGMGSTTQMRGGMGGASQMGGQNAGMGSSQGYAPQGGSTMSDGYGYDTTGGLGSTSFGGMGSSARNVHNTLSSLSESAGSPRTSRYGQSILARSSPSTFDVSKGDRASSWDNSYSTNKSLVDAGKKDHPGSKLGFLASSTSRRVKEIDRCVYDDECRPAGGQSMPQIGSTVGEFGDFGGYDKNSYYEDNSGYPLQQSNVADPYQSDVYEPSRTGQYDSDYDTYGRDDSYDDRYDSRGIGRRNTFDKSTKNTFGRVRDRFADDDEYFDPMYDSPRQGPREDYYDDTPRRPNGGTRPFGVDRRNIDYQSMNRPLDGSNKENYGYNTRNRQPRGIGEFDRPVQSKWGHVGQSLIDYQVKPPRRRGPQDTDFMPPSRGQQQQNNDFIDVTPGQNQPDFNAGFDPMYDQYDDPYYEQY